MTESANAVAALFKPILHRDEVKAAKGGWELTFWRSGLAAGKTWMAGTSPAMTENESSALKYLRVPACFREQDLNALSP